MLVLGLVLILLAIGLFVGVLVGGADDSARFDVGVIDASLSTLSVFLVGALTMLILLVGFSLVGSGLRRARQRRKDSKELSRLSKERDGEQSHSRGFLPQKQGAAAPQTTRTTQVPDQTPPTTTPSTYDPPADSGTQGRPGA